MALVVFIINLQVQLSCANLGLEKRIKVTLLFDLNALGCVVPSHEPFIHCGAFPALFKTLTHCPKASWTAPLFLLLPIL